MKAGAVDDRSCICMYTPTADGGHARYAWELTTALASNAGHRFRYELVSSLDLNLSFHSPAYPTHRFLPILLDRRSFRTRVSWGCNRVAHYLRREHAFLRWLSGRPDIVAVHFQEWTPWLAAFLVRRIRAMGKSVYYTVHNVVPHKYPPLVPRALMHQWLRRGCRSCNVLFVHTDRLADELSDFLGPNHPPIHVVPHGVWTIPEPQASPATCRDPNRLLFFGTIRRNKGLDLLLRALELLPDYSLTIAGECEDPEYFRKEILPRLERLKSKGADVSLIDRFISDDEVPGLFTTHSAIVLPYTDHFRAQSGVAYMALAYGLPVVASEVGGLTDLFARFSIGTTFAEPSPEALASAIRALGENQSHVTAQLQAAREQYSWREAAQRTAAGHAFGLQQRTEQNDRVLETVSSH